MCWNGEVRFAVLRKISYLRWNEEPVDINVDKSTLKSKYFEFTILEFLTFMIYTQLKHIIHSSQSMCYFLMVDTHAWVSFLFFYDENKIKFLLFMHVMLSKFFEKKDWLELSFIKYIVIYEYDLMFCRN